MCYECVYIPSLLCPVNIVERTVLFVTLRTELCFWHMHHKAMKHIDRPSLVLKRAYLMPRPPHRGACRFKQKAGSPAWYLDLKFSTFGRLLKASPCFCSTSSFPTLAVPQLLDIPALPSVGLWLLLLANELIYCSHKAMPGFFPLWRHRTSDFPLPEKPKLPFFPCCHSPTRPAQLDVVVIEGMVQKDANIWLLAMCLPDGQHSYFLLFQDKKIHFKAS